MGIEPKFNMSSRNNTIITQLVEPNPGLPRVTLSSPVEYEDPIEDASRIAGANESSQEPKDGDETDKREDGNETDKREDGDETDKAKDGDKTDKAKGQPKTPRFDYTAFKAVARGFNITSHGQNLNNQMTALEEFLSFRYGKDDTVTKFKADDKVMYAIWHTKKVQITAGAPEVPFREIPGFAKLMQAINVEQPALKVKKDKKAEAAAENEQQYEDSVALFWSYYEGAITQMAGRCQDGRLDLTAAATQIALRCAANRYLEDPSETKKPLNHITDTMIIRNMNYGMACDNCLPQRKRKADAMAAPAENNPSA